ncbi:MAG: hypothetical protein KC583_04765, partial [Myxococcales bacterium]|nr:hypothetical protein [Myxococcales bacterium]
MKLSHAALASLLFAAGCGEDSTTTPGPNGELAVGAGDVTKVEPGKEDSSAEAIVLDMKFEGALVTDQGWNAKSQIEDQLLYTIGHLNGSKAVGRLDKVELTDVKTAPLDGRTEVTYTASLQVAWQKGQGVPTEYTFTLPRDVSYGGLKTFADTYGHDCVDYGAHDVDSGSMWYYYRPARGGCDLADADVVVTTATVTVSPVNTTG